MSHVVYIRHEGERVSVFTRSPAGELAQVGQFVSLGGDVDPLRALALVSDLDLTFGWTAANGTAVTHALPSVVPPTQERAASKPSKPKPRPRVVTNRRDVVLEMLAAAGGAMSVGDMQATGRIQAADVRDGRLHGTLGYLVAQGRIVRTGETGSFRWQLAEPPTT